MINPKFFFIIYSNNLWVLYNTCKADKGKTEDIAKELYISYPLDNNIRNIQQA